MAAISTGVGLAKSELIDRPQEKRDRELAARTQELSPWTGLRANPVKNANPMGNAMGYGMAGLGTGLSWQQANDAHQLRQNKINRAQPITAGVNQGNVDDALVLSHNDARKNPLMATASNPWAPMG